MCRHSNWASILHATVGGWVRGSEKVVLLVLLYPQCGTHTSDWYLPPPLLLFLLCVGCVHLPGVPHRKRVREREPASLISCSPNYIIKTQFIGKKVQLFFFVRDTLFVCECVWVKGKKSRRRNINHLVVPRPRSKSSRTRLGTETSITQYYNEPFQALAQVALRQLDHGRIFFTAMLSLSLPNRWDEKRKDGFFFSSLKRREGEGSRPVLPSLTGKFFPMAKHTFMAFSLPRLTTLKVSKKLCARFVGVVF